MKPVPLPTISTDDSVTAAMPAPAASVFGPVLDAWVDAPDWPARGAVADRIYALMPPGEGVRGEAIGLVGRAVITALLEQLGEREIATITAACAYRVSDHAAWRIAATLFLEQIEDSLLGEWMSDHPAWIPFAFGSGSALGDESSGTVH